MADETIRTVIQLRRDTTANWTLHGNVVPAAGEPCLDLDTGTIKYDDGINTYKDLEYASTIAEGSVIKTELAEDLQISLDKADTALQDSDVAAVAKSGDISDLTQASGDYIVFNCGDASTII